MEQFSRKRMRAAGLAAFLMGMLSLVMVPAAQAKTLRVGEGLDPSVPDHYTTISAALSAATAGDVVRVESGVYNESIDIPQEVTVIGSGSHETGVLINTAKVRPKSVIMGCRVDGRLTLYWADGCKILNCFVKGDIYSNGAISNVHIENCVILKGLSIGSVSSSVISNSVVIGCALRYLLYLGENTVFIGNTWESGDSQTNYISIGGGSVLCNNLIKVSNILANRTIHSSTICNHNTIVTTSEFANYFTPTDLWRNNILYTTDTASIDANGNLTGNPLFTDAANGDYTLASGSPAINAGKGLDADGSVADIGMTGGVRANMREAVPDEAGKPVVGHVVVTPNPVVPGEPLRVRFLGWSNP